MVGPLYVALLLGFFAVQLDAVKIAVFTRDMASSHVIWHKRVSETLAKAGHNVTIIKLTGSVPSKKPDIPIDPSVTVWNVPSGGALNQMANYRSIHSNMAFT
uniref:Glyco_trans_4-like_N domain-containing protein n=1 Tax=Steinernema glaseri TaxID=37863 RepID=A0A1I7Z0P8_9BILA